ncbi:MAG: bacillithiol biosynthesis BshC, partial [Sinomicrobium sp.]|nr:bacillithiol biosynthesis BshC [Sinomicrobium sp.]
MIIWRRTKRYGRFITVFPNRKISGNSSGKKKAAFPPENRIRLSDILQMQYRHINASETTLRHIEMLRETYTFTVTTGHQLNIF